MTLQKRWKNGLIAGALVVVGLALVWGHGRLPPLEPRSPTPVVDTSGTGLAQALSPVLPAHPNQSGIVPVSSGTEAFAVRAQLAEAAQHSLDVQYYIWRDDLSGTLMLDALRRAAERGVHVRMLLDDAGTTGMDGVLSALDAHPNIEVRLFNPFAQRRARWLALLTDFPRLNRRMHNKTFTADRAATIIGGRNVGDEYFGVSPELDFIDLDVLAVGPIVEAVSRDFDRYWDSRSSYPIERLVGRPDEADVARQRELAERRAREPGARTYLEALQTSAQVRRLLARELDFEWTTVKLVSDDPAKVLGEAESATMLPALLRDLLGTPKQELQIVSSYFVPTDGGVELLASLVRTGVKVSVLTNSLAATDVAAVHAGYARYREPLLRAGITLHEMKAQPDGGGSGRVSVAGSGRPGSGSSSSLHAKTFAVDRQRIFIGSFNFDPRSAMLNTEMGFVIDSTRLASAVSDRFIDGLREEAWLVQLDEDRELRWYDAERDVVVDQEPDTSAWLRGLVGVLSMLPIDPLL